MPAPPHPRWRKRLSHLYRKTPGLTLTVMVLLIAWTFGRFFIGAEEVGPPAVLLLTALGIACLIFARDAGRTGVLSHDEGSRRVFPRRKENPKVFRFLNAMQYIVGVGLIVLPLIYLFLPERATPEEALRMQRIEAEKMRGLQERAQRAREALEKRVKELQEIRKRSQ